MKKITKVIALTIVALSTGAISQAQVVYLNLGSESITNWNNISTANGDLSAGSVIDSTGNVLAGVSINTSSFNGATNNGSDVSSYASNGTAPSWIVDDALKTTWNRGFTTTTPAIIEFTGLSTSETYMVELIAARSAGPSQRGGDYLLNGAAATSPSSIGFNAYTNGWENAEVISWTGISGTDTLTLEAAGAASNNFAYVTAMRISVIPEPSTYALLVGSFGILFVVLKRRR